MPRRHLRRYQAPGWWPIQVKAHVWVVRPSPGPHPLARSIPLAIVLRDVLKYAKTLREARRIIGNGAIKVDGRVRRDYKYPVGLMDLVEIVPTGEVYRFAPHPTKFLAPVPVSGEEARIKLVRIENKTIVKGGYVQLNLHDGRNIQLTSEEGFKYRTLGTLKITVPEQEILDYVEPVPGSYAVVIGGRNVGSRGTIEEIIQTIKRRQSTVAIRAPDGALINTVMDYVMAVGRQGPLVALP